MRNAFASPGGRMEIGKILVEFPGPALGVRFPDGREELWDLRAGRGYYLAPGYLEGFGEVLAAGGADRDGATVAWMRMMLAPTDLPTQ